MPFFLFLAILALATAATIALRHVERLAKLRDYATHRRAAKWFLVALTLVVIILETLLRTDTVVLTVPTWLYIVHVIAAIKTYGILATKAVTAWMQFFSFHAWLSKPLWFFWWPTMGTAVLIGAWNLLVA